MEFPKTSKIEKILSKDPTQRILENPFLVVEEGRGFIMASGGQNGIIIPVEVEPEDVSGPIPVEAVKEVRKTGGSIQCGPVYAVTPSGAAYPRSMQLNQYPPIKNLLVQPGPDVVEVSLNAKLLYEMAQAMGAEILKLRVPVGIAEGIDGAVQHTGGPVGVEPHGSEPHVPGVRGAILPYRVARV